MSPTLLSSTSIYTIYSPENKINSLPEIVPEFRGRIRFVFGGELQQQPFKMAPFWWYLEDKSHLVSG